MSSDYDDYDDDYIDYCDVQGDYEDWYAQTFFEELARLIRERARERAREAVVVDMIDDGYGS